VRDPTSALVRDKDGQPLKNSDGTPRELYTVTYRSENRQASDDFAKQLLVLLGTLMAAITSFYLGAGTATSAAVAVAQATDTTKPTITSINPTTHSIAAAATLHLEVMGNNLNVITHVKIVRAGGQVIGANVTSNPTKGVCDIAVGTATTPLGAPWDVVVDDGATKSTTLPAALTIAA
jgi:hypothetical protein